MKKETPISVVKINAIAVPEGRGADLEARFSGRAHGVEAQPGFESFQLLRPVASWTTTTPMYSGGWDAAVANAHGFQVETVNGQTVSVPVTAAAKQLVAAEGSKSLAVTPDNSVTGDCGTSTVTAFEESGGRVKVLTSYVVREVSVE